MAEDTRDAKAAADKAAAPAAPSFADRFPALRGLRAHRLL